MFSGDDFINAGMVAVVNRAFSAAAQIANKVERGSYMFSAKGAMLP